MGLVDGKLALVTGAGRGIGSEIARLLASEGARVALHYHRSGESAEALAAGIGGVALRADLTLPDEARRLAAAAVDFLGGIDILVNNAASFTHGAAFVDDDWESYRREIDGVLGVTFHITRAIAPMMIAAGRGRIINTGATLLWRPVEKYGPHIVAKAAVLGLTRSLVQELGPHGITVNAVQPGMTLTDYSSSLPAAQRTAIASRTPLRRIADPSDVARAVLLLASDFAGFVSGANLAVDGGLVTL